MFLLSIWKENKIKLVENVFCFFDLMDSDLAQLLVERSQNESDG